MTSTPALRDPAQPPPVADDLRRMWRRRHFVIYSARSDLRVRQMDTLLGTLWLVIDPALQILIYYLIFGLLLEADRGVDNFLPFLAIGVFSFSYMRKVILGCAKSLPKSRGLISSMSFPRALIPVSVAVAEAIAFAFPALVMLVATVITGETVTWRWLMLVPVFLLQALFALGAGFVAARITFYFRDFENILAFLLRMAFYFSGVLFLVDRYVTNETARVIVDFNPFLAFISLYRWCLMGMDVNGRIVGSAIVWALAGIVIGYLWFRAREQEYGRD